MLQKFRPLFQPSSVAILGVSAIPYKWGFVILHNILRGGYAGRLFPINPKGGEILGVKVFPSLRDVPGPVDLAIICIPREGVPQAMADCAAKGVGAVFMITAGFSELGGEAAGFEREIIEKAARHGILLAGPNGEGIVNTGIRLYAQMANHHPPAGPISMVSQSGNIAASIMHMCILNGIGFEKFVSSGNEAVLSFCDYLEYFGEDPDTGVVAIYVEGLDEGQGRRLLEVARAVTPKKPVVLFKGGETRAGAHAAASHTGAMASSGAIFDAACAQAGVVKARDIQDCFDTLAAFASGVAREGRGMRPLPKGRRVAILTVGGGWGVIAADACEREGLELAKLSPGTISKLDAHMPAWWARTNPIDSAGGATAETMTGCLGVLMRAPEIDSLLVCGIGLLDLAARQLAESPYADRHGIPEFVEMMRVADMNDAETLVRLSRETGKPVFLATDTVLVAREQGNRTLKYLLKNGLPTFPTPERAARALAQLTRSAFRRRDSRGNSP